MLRSVKKPEEVFMVKTKSVYDEPSRQDGIRVLVTRYWPRGVRKEAKDYWIKELAPSRGLIKEWKSGKISWGEFRRRYQQEYKAEGKAEHLERVKGILREEGRKNVTLLCTCREDEHCHRRILKEKLT